jgi:AraC-like DNA-binding protein
MQDDAPSGTIGTAWYQPPGPNMNTRLAVNDQIQSLDFKILALQRIKMQREWTFQQVISPFSHLWFVTAGHATIKHHGSAFELRPGCSHLVTPLTLYDGQGEDCLDCFQLHFVSHLPGGMELFSAMDCDWQVVEQPDFKQLLERLWSIFSGRDLTPAGAMPRGDRYPSAALVPGKSGNPLAHDAEAQFILRQLLQPFLASTKLRQSSQATVAPPFLAVYEFMNRHLDEPIMLADLARVAGLHPTYFSDRFQRLTGVRPLEYLMHLRMDRARHLLRSSKNSIKEVTFNIGLRDPAYFSRVFLKYCHVSPSEYRSTCHV